MLTAACVYLGLSFLFGRQRPPCRSGCAGVATNVAELVHAGLRTLGGDGYTMCISADEVGAESLLLLGRSRHSLFVLCLFTILWGVQDVSGSNLCQDAGDSLAWDSENQFSAQRRSRVGAEVSRSAAPVCSRRSKWVHLREPHAGYTGLGDACGP